ncbi:hypothetical protein [Glycomyces buryatensis]|uniref:PKD domain-containing protein n=1 Tax=Glycomyces buryatensis TaxID=2570927 RepID=A0A4S8PVS3_9ACTN|nr:hypothetical protein [Glycomyces buryatensis]THV35687.1 hypothetical protein FAB82_22695 [Glycomyces buryatensis]
MLKLIRTTIVATGLFSFVLLASPGTVMADNRGDVECPPGEPACDLYAGEDGEGSPESPSDDSPTSPIGDDHDENGPAPGEGDGSECAAIEYTDLPVEEWPEKCQPEPESDPVPGLAAAARDRLALPGPDLAASPADRQLVHLPVWLAVSESSWNSVSASVTAGSVTVTATAAPSRVVWDLGDGSEVECEGPGTIWRPGMAPDAESPDGCDYTYTRSASEVDVTATVYWTVAWTSTTGDSGSFADLATVSETTWEVAEARSVIVR